MRQSAAATQAQPPVKRGDSYLLVNDRDEDMEAYDHIGQLYADYEQNPNPPCSDTAMAYGWYSFDMEELEGQEVKAGRAGIMVHGG